MNAFWVPDWREAWRWFSVRAMVLAIAIQTAWELAPPDLKTKIPPDWMPYITILVLTAGILGRLIQQGPAEKPEPPNVDDPG